MSNFHQQFSIGGSVEVSFRCQWIGLKQPYHRPQRQSATCAWEPGQALQHIFKLNRSTGGARRPIFGHSTPVCMACRFGNPEL